MNEAQEVLTLTYKAHSPELQVHWGKEPLPKYSDDTYFSDWILHYTGCNCSLWHGAYCV